MADGVANGPNLSVLDRLDDHARRLADVVAVESGDQSWTYSQLAEISLARARWLRSIVGSDEPQVVAVSSDVSVDYLTVYYAALRAGHIVLPVLPMAREQQLAHYFELAQPAVFVGNPRVAGLARRLGLGAACRIVDFADVPSEVADDQPLGTSSDRVASMLFTGGTTGSPKCAALSMANVSINAAQVAETQAIAPGVRALLSFPTYHPMHMNSHLWGGATQILSGSDAPGLLVDAARTGATRLFTIPAIVSRMAVQPLTPAEHRLEFIASGGSPMDPTQAAALSKLTGCPVIQGYGLAECSPFTHFDDPANPNPKSVGFPAPRTECRIAPVKGAASTSSGSVGEIQIRGPQVMRGYVKNRAELEALLASDAPETPDWLSTGDIGYLAEGGRLHVVDRMKDTYKYNDVMVSPMEIETRLRELPGIVDAIVIDGPDDTFGSLGYARVVSRSPLTAAEQEALRLEFNSSGPEYHQLAELLQVDSIPRTPVGKPFRREIRLDLHKKLQGRDRTVVMVSDIVALGDPAEYERAYAEFAKFLVAQPGFLEHRLSRSLAKPGRYLNSVLWRSALDQLAVVSKPEFQRHAQQLARLAMFTPELFESIQSAEGGGAQ